MAELDPVLGKEDKNGFIRAISSEKHERVARRSLQDLIVFYQALDNEIRELSDKHANGVPHDVYLLERMLVIKEQYQHVMNGFLELDEHSQRHALIVFADNVQDLMKYIHTRRAA